MIEPHVSSREVFYSYIKNILIDFASCDRLYQSARSIFHHLVSSSISVVTSNHLQGFLNILIMTSMCLKCSYTQAYPWVGLGWVYAQPGTDLTTLDDRKSNLPSIARIHNSVRFQVDQTASVLVKTNGTALTARLAESQRNLDEIQPDLDGSH